jgi:hypothetical protein
MSTMFAQKSEMSEALVERQPLGFLLNKSRFQGGRDGAHSLSL